MRTAATYRTEAELLHALADELRTGRHDHHLSDAVLAVMHGEPRDRWTNLAAALVVDLGLTGEEHEVNRFDRDELPHDGQPDHPGAYAMRLDVWAAQLGDPALIADRLDEIADREASELACPVERARIGGRRFRGYMPTRHGRVLWLVDEVTP